MLVAITDRVEPGVILTQRTETLRRHAGQVAFPGGRLDPGEDAVAAALREAEEEIAYPKLKSRKVIAGEEEEHGEKEHAATNEALLHLLRAKGTDTQKFQDALEAVAEVLNHHIGEEEQTILNPAREDASEELRQQLGADWAARRNELLEDGAGSLEQVESLVKQAYEDGLLPNDDQPS